MERLNEILRELGISKVKLAKCLGVSRQMIYNYLELDDLNKWPKDKKVILLNILGIKSAEDFINICNGIFRTFPYSHTKYWTLFFWILSFYTRRVLSNYHTIRITTVI